MASARLLHGRESRVQSSELKHMNVSGEQEVIEKQRKKVDHMDRRGTSRTRRKRRGKKKRRRAEKEEKQRKRLIGGKKRTAV